VAISGFKSNTPFLRLSSSEKNDQQWNLGIRGMLPEVIQ